MINYIEKLSQNLFNDKDEIMSDEALSGMSAKEKKSLKEELEKQHDTNVKQRKVSTKSITLGLYQQKLISKLSK